MKARVFPKLDMPEDLDNISTFIDHYDTVQEQIDFLKFVKLEMELYYEQKYAEDFDSEKQMEYDKWNIIVEKKLHFYEKMLEDEQKRIEKTNKDGFGLYEFNFDKIKGFAETLNKDEAIIYLKYVRKEFDREKRENTLLFLTREEIEKSKKEMIRFTNDENYENFDLWGIGNKQRLDIENFEKNILNEIDFLTEKNKVSDQNKNVEIIDEPMSYETMLDTYYDYGRECFLSTWKDEYQFLTFEQKMIDRYGDKIKQYTYQLYKFVSQKTNPIEFINCNISQFIYQTNNEKLKKEIIRIDNYIKELEKLEYNTSDEKNMNIIPEDELEKYDEWQCYFIEKIKYEELEEWVDILRKNRPGVTDYKYGEFYQIDFKNVTNFGLTELRNYRDRLGGFLLMFETNTSDNDKFTEPLLKPFGRGELQEAVEPFAKEFNLVIGESAKSTKVRTITKRLIKQGWDANEASVSEALRKLGYVKGRRK